MKPASPSSREVAAALLLTVWLVSAAAADVVFMSLNTSAPTLVLSESSPWNGTAVSLTILLCEPSCLSTDDLYFAVDKSLTLLSGSRMQIVSPFRACSALSGGINGTVPRSLTITVDGSRLIAMDAFILEGAYCHNTTISLRNLGNRSTLTTAARQPLQYLSLNNVTLDGAAVLLSDVVTALWTFNHTNVTLTSQALVSVTNSTVLVWDGTAPRVAIQNGSRLSMSNTSGLTDISFGCWENVSARPCHQSSFVVQSGSILSMDDVALSGVTPTIQWGFAFTQSATWIVDDASVISLSRVRGAAPNYAAKVYANFSSSLNASLIISRGSAFVVSESTLRSTNSKVLAVSFDWTSARGGALTIDSGSRLELRSTAFTGCVSVTMDSCLECLATIRNQSAINVLQSTFATDCDGFSVMLRKANNSLLAILDQSLVLVDRVNVTTGTGSACGFSMSLNGGTNCTLQIDGQSSLLVQNSFFVVNSYVVILDLSASINVSFLVAAQSLVSLRNSTAYGKFGTVYIFMSSCTGCILTFDSGSGMVLADVNVPGMPPYSSVGLFFYQAFTNRSCMLWRNGSYLHVLRSNFNTTLWPAVYIGIQNAVYSTMTMEANSSILVADSRLVGPSGAHIGIAIFSTNSSVTLSNGSSVTFLRAILDAAVGNAVLFGSLSRSTNASLVLQDRSVVHVQNSTLLSRALGFTFGGASIATRCTFVIDDDSHVYLSNSTSIQSSASSVFFDFASGDRISFQLSRNSTVELTDSVVVTGINGYLLLLSFAYSNNCSMSWRAGAQVLFRNTSMTSTGSGLFLQLTTSVGMVFSVTETSQLVVSDSTINTTGSGFVLTMETSRSASVTFDGSGTAVTLRRTNITATYYCLGFFMALVNESRLVFSNGASFNVVGRVGGDGGGSSQLRSSVSSAFSSGMYGAQNSTISLFNGSMWSIQNMTLVADTGDGFSLTTYGAVNATVSFVSHSRLVFVNCNIHTKRNGVFVEGGSSHASSFVLADGSAFIVSNCTVTSPASYSIIVNAYLSQSFHFITRNGSIIDVSASTLTGNVGVVVAFQESTDGLILVESDSHWTVRNTTVAGSAGVSLYVGAASSTRSAFALRNGSSIELISVQASRGVAFYWSDSRQSSVVVSTSSHISILNSSISSGDNPSFGFIADESDAFAFEVSRDTSIVVDESRFSGGYGGGLTFFATNARDLRFTVTSNSHIMILASDIRAAGHAPLSFGFVGNINGSIEISQSSLQIVDCFLSNSGGTLFLFRKLMSTDTNSVIRESSIVLIRHCTVDAEIRQTDPQIGFSVRNMTRGSLVFTESSMFLVDSLSEVSGSCFSQSPVPLLPPPTVVLNVSQGVNTTVVFSNRSQFLVHGVSPVCPTLGIVADFRWSDGCSMRLSGSSLIEVVNASLGNFNNASTIGILCDDASRCMISLADASMFRVFNVVAHRVTFSFVNAQQASALSLESGSRVVVQGATLTATGTEPSTALNFANASANTSLTLRGVSELRWSSVVAPLGLTIWFPRSVTFSNASSLEVDRCLLGFDLLRGASSSSGSNETAGSKLLRAPLSFLGGTSDVASVSSTASLVRDEDSFISVYRNTLWTAGSNATPMLWIASLEIESSESTKAALFRIEACRLLQSGSSPATGEGIRGRSPESALVRWDEAAIVRYNSSNGSAPHAAAMVSGVGAQFQCVRLADGSLLMQFTPDVPQSSPGNNNGTAAVVPPTPVAVINNSGCEFSYSPSVTVGHGATALGQRATGSLSLPSASLPTPSRDIDRTQNYGGGATASLSASGPGASISRNSLSTTLSNTSLPPPDPTPPPAGATAVALQRMSASTAVASSLVIPTAALGINRIGLVSGLGNCGSVDELPTEVETLSAPIPWSNAPMRLSFGPQRGASQRGAVVGNLAVALIAVAVGFLLTLAVWSYRETATTRSRESRAAALLEHAARLHLPGLFFVVVSLLQQQVVQSSVLLLSTSPTAMWAVRDQVFGACGVIVTLIVCGAIVRVLGSSESGFRAVASLRQRRLRANNKATANASPSSTLRSLVPWIGERFRSWSDLITRNSCTWRPRNRDTDRWFVRRYGFLFESCARGRHWWSLVDLLASVLLGVLGGLVPQTVASCQAIVWIAVGISLLYLVVFVIARPIGAPLDAATVFVLALTQLGVALCSALGAPDETEAALGLVGTALSSFFVFLAVLNVVGANAVELVATLTSKSQRHHSKRGSGVGGDDSETATEATLAAQRLKHLIEVICRQRVAAAAAVRVGRQRQLGPTTIVRFYRGSPARRGAPSATATSPPVSH